MSSTVICVIGIASTLASVQPKLAPDTRNWIAGNVCAAANDAAVDPRLLVAYLLTENRGIDLWSIRPAALGNDHGLFQINSYFQKSRPHLRDVHHPYYGALTAAQVMKDNLKQFGWTWQAFAAYWSPGQSQAGTPAARAYYARYATNYQLANRFFTQAGNSEQPRTSVQGHKQ